MFVAAGQIAGRTEGGRRSGKCPEAEWKRIMKTYGSKWKHKRAVIMRRDGYRSQLAARYGRNIPGDTVHHILPVEFFPEYKLTDWNLITITRREHNKLHDRTTHGLTDEGMELAERTALRQGLSIRDIRERMKSEERKEREDDGDQEAEL